MILTVYSNMTEFTHTEKYESQLYALDTYVKWKWFYDKEIVVFMYVWLMILMQKIWRKKETRKRLKKIQESEIG